MDSLAEAATVRDHGETGLPVAGPGAPLVGEFSVTEFAAAIGLPDEAGKAYLGEAVELRYCWPGLNSGPGTCPRGGPAGSPATPCILSLEAAAHVDHQVAHLAHKVRPAQLDRLRRGGHRPVHARGGPNAAAARPPTAGPSPSTPGSPSLTGTSTVYGELDLADALDLDAAGRRRAWPR